MVFEGLAEKYENFIASLEEKGVPNPRILVPIVVLMIIALAVFFAASGFLAPGKTVKVYVKSAADGSFIPNAGVTLYAGDQSFTAKTNSDGMAEFKGVPEKTLSVTVSAQGFQKIINQPLPSDNSITLSPEPQTPASKTITVRVKDAEGNDISGANVVVTFDDGTMKTASSDSFGIAEVSVPIAEAPAHAKVSVEAGGFEKKERSVTQSEFDSTIFIELTAVAKTPFEENKAAVRVSVFDADYNQVSTALVTLIDYYTDAIFRNAKTEEDGSVAFEGIAVGKKFRIAVKHDAYEAFASEDVYTLEADSPTIILTLFKKTIPDQNALKVSVVDEENNPVGGATVTVYDRSTKTMLATETTDYSKREASFSVPKGKTLYITAYADGFLPGFDELAQAGQTKKIVLAKETAGNYFDVTIATLKEGEPAPNALVTLYNANGFPLGIPPAYTGADGTIVLRVPAKVKNAAYALFAVASLESLKGKSDAATPNDDLVLSIALQPEPASLKVRAIDVSTNEAVQNAAVGLSSGGALITTCTTDDKGACEFAIAPNTEFTISATAPGFLQATTATQILDAGEQKEMNVMLYPTALAKNAFSRFLGLFDARGKQVREANNAEFYTARFLVGVPKSSELSSFYASVGTAASAEEDFVAVKDFNAGQTQTVYSGTQAGENCVNEASNESETTDGLMKWVNVALPKNFVGTREVELRVYVKPSAKAGDKIVFNHRLGGATKNVPFLAPTDEENLNALLEKTNAGVTLALSDFCQAATSKNEVPVSRDPLVCDDNGLCYKIVFVSDSQRTRANAGFTVDLGKQFTMRYTLLNTEKEISSLGIVFNENLEYLGHSATQTASTATPKATAQEFKKISLQGREETLAGEREERVSTTALAGEKISGQFEFRALRASASTPVTLKVYYAEQEGSEADALTNYVKISGKNTFRVTIAPLSLVAGLRENARVTVLDSLNNPVTDAVVAFFECEGTPLDGQEIEVAGEDSRGKGEDGIYRTPIEASSVGMIGVRVSRTGFKSYESCNIEVLAGDFITVEPASVKIEGDSSNPGGLAKTMTVTNLLPVTSRITTMVSCIPRGGTYSGTPVMVVPQSFSLSDSASVEIQARENAIANADCFIAFSARINEKNSYTATALAQVKVAAPPVPLPACPTQTKGYKCGPSSQVPANCVTQPQYSCASGESCFACDTGLHTLPSSISLTVSDTKPTDTFDKAIALDSQPDECRVEGFKNNPASLPQNAYNAQYPNTNQNYWNYQPNYWNPQSSYWSNPQFYYMQQLNYPSYYSQYGGLGGYGAGYGSYGTGYWGYGNLGPQVYAGYDLTYQFPVFYGCPNALNYQSMAGSYYAQSYLNPWQQVSMFPSGYPPNCQYPIVCQNPSLCGFINYGLQYGVGQNYFNAYAGVSYGLNCQYQSMCGYPQGCVYLNYPAYPQYQQYQQPFNYQQSKPPVSVRVDSCTQNDLQVTAEYTGNDYYYNGAMGGTQSGYIVIKTGPGEQKKIPITVTVNSPVTQAYPSQQMQPYPFYPQYQTQCWPSYYAQQCPIGYYVNGVCLPTAGGAGVADYTQCGVPSEVRLFANKVTGEARYQRDLQIPVSLRGASLLFKTVNKPNEGTFKVTISSGKLTIDYTAKSVSEGGYSVSDSATYNFYYPQAPLVGTQQQPAGTQQLGCNVEFIVEPDEFGELVVYTQRTSMKTANTEREFNSVQLGSAECVKLQNKNKVRCFYPWSLSTAKCKLKEKKEDFEVSCKDEGINVVYSGELGNDDKTILEIYDSPDYNVRRVQVRVDPTASKELTASETVKGATPTSGQPTGDCKYKINNKEVQGSCKQKCGAKELELTRGLETGCRKSSNKCCIKSAFELKSFKKVYNTEEMKFSGKFEDAYGEWKGAYSLHVYTVNDQNQKVKDIRLGTEVLTLTKDTSSFALSIKDKKTIADIFKESSKVVALFKAFNNKGENIGTAEATVKEKSSPEKTFADNVIVDCNVKFVNPVMLITYELKGKGDAGKIAAFLTSLIQIKLLLKIDYYCGQNAKYSNWFFAAYNVVGIGIETETFIKKANFNICKDESVYMRFHDIGFLEFQEIGTPWNKCQKS